MMSERAFLQNALQGIALSGAFAFVFVMLATMNWIQALITIMCVAFIVTSVIAVMVFAGWELGVSESVAVVILIGFSVDYVVHISKHYQESAFTGRYDRIRESLKEMGISIVSGAITTFGSGIFLFGA